MKSMDRAIFLDRDGVINVESSWITTPEDFQLYPFTATAIRKANQAGWRVIVVTNQSMIARGMSDLDRLSQIHREMERQLNVGGAKVDAIYYCPHHPDFGDRQICDCRKPRTGMIDQGVERFGLDRGRSYLVGDKTVDILAGEKAGLQTILVKTGYAGKDGICEVTPGRIEENLLTAIDAIIGEKIK